MKIVRFWANILEDDEFRLESFMLELLIYYIVGLDAMDDPVIDTLSEPDVVS